jgi:hypothetical protein
MKKRKILGILSLALVFNLGLIACSTGGDDDSTGTNDNGGGAVTL